MNLPPLTPGKRIAVHIAPGPSIQSILEWGWNRSLTLVMLNPKEPIGAQIEGLDLTGIINAAGYESVSEISGDRNVAIEIRTSGSTGAGKWIPIRREMILAHVHAACERLVHTDKSRWLCCLPTHHVGGIMQLYRVLHRGGDITFANGSDYDALAASLPKVTHVSLVPRQLAEVLIQLPVSPGNLQCVLIGGDALPVALATAALDAGYPIHASYGMTETTSLCCVATPEELRRNPGSVGRPIHDVQIQLREGQICVVGPTALDGEFLSEDLGKIANGALFVTGRLQHRIIVNGETLDARAIEEKLVAKLPILGVVVVGIPSPKLGQELCAMVEGDVTDADVKSALSGIERIRQVAIQPIPRSELGKPKRAEVVAYFTALIPT